MYWTDDNQGYFPSYDNMPLEEDNNHGNMDDNQEHQPIPMVERQRRSILEKVHKSLSGLEEHRRLKRWLRSQGRVL